MIKEVAATLVLSLAGSVQAKMLNVSSSGTGDALTLEEALKDSKPGDSLVLLDKGRVGMELIKETAGFLIKRVIANGGAEKAGIKAGELIVKVEGVSTSDMTLLEIVERLGGKAGSKVRLRVERGGTLPELVEVERSATIYPLAEDEPRHEIARKFGDMKAALALAELDTEKYVSARLLLARAYASGSGVSQDFKMAALHATACAEAGDHECEYIYGRMLAAGQGIARNDREALVWLKKAFDGGISEAKSDLSKVKARLSPIGP